MMDSVLKANREQFLTAVKLAAKFTQKSFGPLEGMLLIDGSGRSVTVSGINPGQRRIDATIGCQALVDSWPDGVFVSGRLLTEVLTLLPSPMVRIGWNAKEMVIEGDGDEGRSYQTTLKVRQDEVTRVLLKTAMADDASHFLINADEYGNVAGLAVTARSGDESRPVLTSVRFEIEPTGADNARLAMVCTDGYRLVKVETGVAYHGEATRRNILAPGVEMAHLAGLRCMGDLKFVLAEDKIEIGGMLAGDIEFRLVTHLPDGNYPDYMAIIPKTDGDVMSVDLSELRRHLAAAKTFKRDDQRVDITFDGDAMRLKVSDPEKGDFESACPITHAATEPVAIAMNMAYFDVAVAGLLALGIAEPTMHFHAPTRPFVLKGEKGTQRATVVIMPMVVPR
jgi:DNA polymerase III sliding clamp (beta) subunit (PCNA family)